MVSLTETVSWLSTFARPGLILVCGMLLFNLPTLIYKIGMFVRGIVYLVLCNDKSWKKPQDPVIVVGPLLFAAREGELEDGILEKKTVYFVRHGESTWNDTFNKGSHRSAFAFVIGFVPGLIKALLFELYLILSGKLDRYVAVVRRGHRRTNFVSFVPFDLTNIHLFGQSPDRSVRCSRHSWFYDAPASNLGLGQVKDLSNFLNHTKNPGGSLADHIAVLRASPDAPQSKILCSSLRRAVTTIAAGFKDRLSRRPQEKVLIVPSLQEISRNPDTLSITPAHTPIQASWIDKTSKMADFQSMFINQVDMSLHIGNKPLNTNGLKRMREFCQFVFSPSVKEKHVIVGGHSIWFRSFFRTFLPYGEDHVGKQKKIVNCGIVALTLIKARRPSGEFTYMIDPTSVEVVYGGFH